MPADLRAFDGVRFDVRGEGDYLFMICTRAVRNYDYHQAGFTAGAEWSTVEIPFHSLKQTNGAAAIAWTGDDALELIYRIERPAGQGAWLELDNVSLY